MVGEKGNHIAYIFTIFFVLINVLLHKDDGPLNPLKHHPAIAYRYCPAPLYANSKQVSVTEQEQAPKIEKKKLRVRYKGSEVTFALPLLIRYESRPFVFVKDYNLPHRFFVPFHLQLVAGQRAPPAV